MNISSCFAVEPSQYIPEIKIISRVEIHIINIELFKSVHVVATLYDEANRIIENKHFYIDGDDYANWSSDDSYLVNLVLNRLGLSLSQGGA
jgi:hypothetical protein